MMVKSYDLLVHGTGTAARVAALRRRAAGWSVAVVDCRPFGGTCALRGCDPKKMLIGGVSVIDHAWRMQGKGVAGVPRIDWPELLAFKRSLTDPVPQKHEDSYAEKGIATFHGRARFSLSVRVKRSAQLLPCGAVARRFMRFVPIKTADQQRRAVGFVQSMGWAALKRGGAAIQPPRRSMAKERYRSDPSLDLFDSLKMLF